MSAVKAIDVIDRLPLELQGWIESHQYFCDIPVVVFDKGNVEKELATKTSVITSKGGKKGVAVVIMPVIADDEEAELVFGPMTLRIGVQVVEQVELNNGPYGTGKSARKVARKLRDVIKPCRFVGLTTDFVTEKNCITPVDMGKQLADLVRGYMFTCYTWEADDEELNQVAMPQFSKVEDSGPRLKMECATPGAQIWYSLDDSLPGPNRPGSLLYAAPIAITDDAVLRAAAFLEPSIGSFVHRVPISLIT